MSLMEPYLQVSITITYKGYIADRDLKYFNENILKKSWFNLFNLMRNVEASSQSTTINIMMFSKKLHRTDYHINIGNGYFN